MKLLNNINYQERIEGLEKLERLVHELIRDKGVLPKIAIEAPHLKNGYSKLGKSNEQPSNGGNIITRGLNWIGYLFSERKLTEEELEKRTEELKGSIGNIVYQLKEIKSDL